MSSTPQTWKLDSPIGGMLKVFFGGSGAGLGMGLMWMFAQMLRTQPKLIELMISAVAPWGPMFILLLVGMYFANQKLGVGIEIIRQHAIAQQQLADAVTGMAARDDRQIQEIQTLTAFTAQQSRDLKETLTEMGEHLKAISRQLAEQQNRTTESKGVDGEGRTRS